MTSTTSTTIYSEPDLSKLLGYVRHLKQIGGNFGFAACVFGKPNVLHPIRRFLTVFSGRLMTYFGESLLVRGRSLGR